MKTPILTTGVILFLGPLFLATGSHIGDVDMTSIMNKNSNFSGTNTAAAKITYKARGNGVPVTGYLFSKETSNSLTLTAYINGVASPTQPTSGDDWGSTQYAFSSNGIAAGTPVQFKVHAITPNPGVDYFNDQKAADNLYHMMNRGSFSYDKSGIDIPPGIWMGWEDWTYNAADNPHSDMDYNDMCMVVQGLDEFATDGSGHTVQVKPPTANMGTCIISWREENLF
jgi:hypothetical protein